MTMGQKKWAVSYHFILNEIKNWFRPTNGKIWSEWNNIWPLLFALKLLLNAQEGFARELLNYLILTNNNFRFWVKGYINWYIFKFSKWISWAKGKLRRYRKFAVIENWILKNHKEIVDWFKIVLSRINYNETISISSLPRK